MDHANAMQGPGELISDVSIGAATTRSHGRKRHVMRWIAALIVASLVLRLWAMHAVVLVPEEAYYWNYAQHPNLSYFDHPPMVAWVIGAGTFVFGHGEFGVRFFGCLLMLAAAALLYWHGRTWYGRDSALLGAAGVLVLPVYFATGFVATMDAPLVFFWSVGLFAVSLAIKNSSRASWYLFGAALGGAMLSKYTGVFLGVGALGVLVMRRHRRHLLTPHPYLAALLALAIFSPTLIWNAQHDWASFRFQFFDRFEGKQIGWLNPLQFLGLQLAVATPVLLIGAAAIGTRALARWRAGRRISDRTWLAVAFSLPLLVVMAYKSLRYDVHVNWTLPAYLSLMPATVHLLRCLSRRALLLQRNQRPNPIEWTAMICVWINVVMTIFVLVARPGRGAMSAMGPWPQLAALIEEYEDRMELATGDQEPLIVADGKYRLASVLAFYRTPIEEGFDAAQFTSSQWLLYGEGLGYEYWRRPEDWLGKNCIVVDDDRELSKIVKDRFDRVEMINDPRLSALNYQAAMCYGYRGPVAASAR